MRLSLWLTLATILTLGTVFGQKASKPSLVANLKNNAVADGCGCYFKFRGTPRNSELYVFSSSIDDEKTAWMNIGGRDVKLTLEKEPD